MDTLKKKLNDLYSNEELDEIKLNLNLELDQINNLADFYIFVIENKFYLNSRIKRDLKKIFKIDNNPFLHKYYYLEVGSYLYENNLIKYLPLNVNNKVKK